MCVCVCVSVCLCVCVCVCAGDQFDLKLNWDDVARIKDMWGGKLIIKGIFDPEDAQRCIHSELADALIVSNHGGRQLDGAESSISMLGQIVQSVRGPGGGSSTCSSRHRDVEIWMDGGIRSGQDVLRAVAMGASGTMLGRSYVYGLGAGGQEGVERSLQIIRTELDKTMALCGYRDINMVNADILAKTCPFL
jgi:L-lactate dehydrogenase (cytochrome)